MLTILHDMFGDRHPARHPPREIQTHLVDAGPQAAVGPVPGAVAKAVTPGAVAVTPGTVAVTPGTPDVAVEKPRDQTRDHQTHRQMAHLQWTVMMNTFSVYKRAL